LPMPQLLYFSGPGLYIVAASLALVLVLISIPSIIRVAAIRGLDDDADTERKEHKDGIPRLGGVAIYCSIMITCLLAPPLAGFKAANILFASCLILFAVGLKDDLSGVNPSTKFAMQFIVAVMMVFLGDVRLTSMYGLFNVYDLSYFSSAF